MHCVTLKTLVGDEETPQQLELVLFQKTQNPRWVVLNHTLARGWGLGGARSFQGHLHSCVQTPHIIKNSENIFKIKKGNILKTTYAKILAVCNREK